MDMVRSGLLDPSSLPTPSQTQVINDYPNYEEVPLAIYAGMPQWLKDVCGLTTPAIPSDGKATILHVAGTAPVEAGTSVASFTMPYAQILRSRSAVRDRSHFLGWRCRPFEDGNGRQEKKFLHRLFYVSARLPRCTMSVIMVEALIVLL